MFVDSSDDPKTRLAIGAFKQLRTHVLRELNEMGAKSLLVTGPTAGVGKTTVSLNLAINISRLPNQKVVLVDLDLRGSSMQNILGIQHDYGTEMLSDAGFSMNRAAVSIGCPRLLVLTCAKRTTDSSEVLHSPVAKSLFKRLRNLPDGYITIYDSPPVLGCDDVPTLLPSMESALMVVEEGNSSRREFKDSMSLMSSVPVVGTVLNKSKDQSFGKYYY